jgi:hypothetical protein
MEPMVQARSDAGTEVVDVDRVGVGEGDRDHDRDRVRAYHQRSKHALAAYAAGPETLDWDAQPAPFRRWTGTPLQPLPLMADRHAAAHPLDWSRLPEAPASPLDLEHLALLFELSFGLSAWKRQGPDRWAVRMTPSSGNLHPSEAWLRVQGVNGLVDGLHHYAPYEHGLELRCHDAVAPRSASRAWVGLSSIAWREIGRASCRERVS